jgi:hypothetical protein
VEVLLLIFRKVDLLEEGGDLLLREEAPLLGFGDEVPELLGFLERSDLSKERLVFDCGQLYTSCRKMPFPCPLSISRERDYKPRSLVLSGDDAR